MKPVLIVFPLIIGAVAISAVAGTPTAARPARSNSAQAATTTRTFLLSAGRAQRRFSMRERDGVMLLTRITASIGVHAFVDARIPHVAGTRFQTAGSRPDPPLRCRPDGALDICTQSQEWCPMPAALWQMHLVKKSGPAGPIRVDFVIGPPPASE